VESEPAAGVRVAFEIDGPVGTITGVDASPSIKCAGDAVLLLHGINMSHDVWRDVISSLVDSRRVIAFDFRGHGRSVKTGPYTAGDYAQDALAVLDARDIDKAHVVGTSFGCNVAIKLALLAPDRVATLGLFGGALRMNSQDSDRAVEFLRSMGLRNFFSSLLPQSSFHQGTAPDIIDRALEAAINNRDEETVIAVTRAALASDMTNEASKIDLRPLVVTGEFDHTCPTSMGDSLAKALGTELVILPGCGHVPSMEVPDSVAELIEQHATALDRSVRHV